MNIRTHKIEIEQLITRYADAVNTANAPAIAALYGNDGLLMPDAVRSIKGPEVNGKYFKRASVTIEYTISDIAINGDFAFVEARAKTKTTYLSTKHDQIKATRDLFVFKNTAGNWKIYRYLFNNEQ
jgi:ketosteroid isomerase-like protein